MRTGRTTPLAEGRTGHIREPWMSNAACTEIDPDMWFPEPGGSIQQQQAICADCPVRNLCLEYALRNDIEHGIWGGLSPKHRKKLRQGAA